MNARHVAPDVEVAIGPQRLLDMRGNPVGELYGVGRAVPKGVDGDAPCGARRLGPKLGGGRAASGAAGSASIGAAAVGGHPPVGNKAGSVALRLVEQPVARLNQRVPQRREAASFAGARAVERRERHHKVTECVVVPRRVIRWIVAVPAAPARAQLERAEGLAVGGRERRVGRREVEEERLARLVGPLRQFRPPCRARAVVLRGKHQEQHAEDGVLVPVRRRASAHFRGDGVVKLPGRQTLVRAISAAHVGILAGVTHRALAHEPPAAEELVAARQDGRARRVRGRQRRRQ